MDQILITTSTDVLTGLRDMLDSFEEGMSSLLDSGTVTVEICLLVIEIAKLTPDKDEWFPHGKWATIQNIQSKCESELKKIAMGQVNPNR